MFCFYTYFDGSHIMLREVEPPHAERHRHSRRSRQLALPLDCLPVFWQFLVTFVFAFVFPITSTATMGYLERKI